LSLLAVAVSVIVPGAVTVVAEARRSTETTLASGCASSPPSLGGIFRSLRDAIHASKSNAPPSSGEPPFFEEPQPELKQRTTTPRETRNRLFIHDLTDWTTKVAKLFTLSLRAPRR
jgi:hypothetical protein